MSNLPVEADPLDIQPAAPAPDPLRPERLEPHSVEAEEAVLGACLLNPDVFSQVDSIITPDDFFILRNMRVFAAMQAINWRDEAIDDLTVIDELRNRGELQELGGPFYITRLANNTPTFYHPATYAEIIKRGSTRRKLLQAASEIAQAAQDEAHDILAISDWAEEALRMVTRERHNRDLVPADHESDQFMRRIEEWSNNPQKIRGFTTGFTDLDSTLGGFSGGDFAVIMGYPGSGKSILMLQMLEKLAGQGPGLVVPTEMTIDAYRLRLLALKLSTYDTVIRNGEYSDWPRLIQAQSEILQLPVHYLDQSAPYPRDIRLAAERLQAAGKCEWVLIDGINDLSVPRPRSVFDDTMEIVKAVHGIARDLNLFVLVTSHINRSNVDRANKEPNPRDLFGGSVTERMASQIISLFRPAALVESGDWKSLPDEYEPDTAYIRVIKSRFGVTGKRIGLYFRNRGPGKYGFENLAKGSLKS